MWSEITRRKYEREGQRYASDVTDADWALIEPHMPAAKPLGRPRDTELGAVLDAILYIARTGCNGQLLDGSSAGVIAIRFRNRPFWKKASKSAIP
jgi:transposase